MITLDIDFHCYNDRIMAFNILIAAKSLKSQCYVRHSSSKNGLHVMMSDEPMNMRHYDCQNRSERAELRKKNGLPEQILFDKKGKLRSGHWVNVHLLSLESLWQAVWKPVTLICHEENRVSKNKPSGGL